MTPAKLAALARASDPELSGTLKLLDEISRPLTVREIERALRDAGHSRTWSARMAGELQHLNLIAITKEKSG